MCTEAQNYPVSSHVSTLIIDVVWVPHSARFQFQAGTRSDAGVHSNGEYLHVPTVGGQCSLICNYIIYNCSKKISERSETTPARTSGKTGNAS